jgi:glycine oxidase
MRCLIVGRGLAGSWLAWYLRKRGVEVDIADDRQTSASHVSAGLINPVTGTRPKASWNASTILPFSRAAYEEVRSELGVDLWFDRPIRRVFLTEIDRQYWDQSVQRGLDLSWSALSGENVDDVALPFGGVEYEGATIDVKAFLQAVDGVTRTVHYAVSVDTVLDYDVVFWCQGWQAARDPRWSWLPFQPVKGEIIDVRITGKPLTAVYVRGVWVIPLHVEGGSQIVRVGATHDWDALNDEVTVEGRDALVQKVEALLGRRVEVIDQRAAVRPAASSKRPYLGRHPQDGRQVILNGLGSKGSLWAPWAAAELVKHVLDGKPLHDEVNIQRWWNDV